MKQCKISLRLQTIFSIIRHPWSTVCPHPIKCQLEIVNLSSLWEFYAKRSTNKPLNAAGFPAISHLIPPQTHAVVAWDWNDHNKNYSAITTVKAESLSYGLVTIWLALAAVITALETEGLQSDSLCVLQLKNTGSGYLQMWRITTPLKLATAKAHWSPTLMYK